MTLVINKSSHCIIEIKSLPSTETKPSRYQLSIGDMIKKTYSQPSSANSFIQELEIVLAKFYEDTADGLPKGFDIHPVKNGWVAIPQR